MKPKPPNNRNNTLNISTTLRRMIYGNKIGYVQDGKSYFFKVSDLNDYINNHYTPAQS